MQKPNNAWKSYIFVLGGLRVKAWITILKKTPKIGIFAVIWFKVTFDSKIIPSEIQVSLNGN